MKTSYSALKTALEDRRREILESDSALAHELKEEIEMRRGDDMDLAESAFEQEMSYILKNRGHEELTAIDEALRKIENNTYGICESCEGKIGLKRLEARPFVKLCINCQTEQEESSKMSSSAF